MSFGEAIQSCFNNYANFNGRASRSEHNYWILFAFFISIVTTILDITFFGLIEISPINTLASLILWLPGLAVAIRRLHDINKSGWWLLLWFAIIIGWIVLLIWHVRPSDKGVNQYG